VQRFQPFINVGLTVSLVAMATAVIDSQERLSRGEWRYFGGDKAFTRYSSLDQINRDNVRNLRIVWRRPAVNDLLTKAFPNLRPNAYLRATPIMVDGVLYTQDAHGLVTAIEGETGRTVWAEDPSFATVDEANAGRPTRGVDYWRGGARNVDKRIFASSCGRSTSCRALGNSATTPGATSLGKSRAISARGIR